MKKFWLVLLSLGLITAFSMSAMAVDVKVSGEYYAAGMYLDKTTLNSDKTASTALPAIPISETITIPAKAAVIKNPGPSTAFYFQRLRLNTMVTVSPGLMLTTRADIMERAWGASRTDSGTENDTMSAGTRAENENIAFDLAYITYISPIGLFEVGYQIDETWGTTFGASSNPKGLITYGIKAGNLTLGTRIGKDMELSRTSNNPTGDADKDQSFYTLFGIYGWKTGEAGLLFRYIKNNQYRDAFAALAPPDAGFAWDGYVLSPFLKAQFGRVALQAQFYYLFGKQSWEGNTAALGYPQDVDLNQLSAYVDATVNLGMFYFGGALAYVSGDDFSTQDKQEGGVLNGGLDWNPCLIMFNNDLTYWAGSQGGYLATDATYTTDATFTANGGPMTNAWFGQLRGGIRPVEKLDIMASVSYAKADKTPAAVWAGREYGWEVDLTGTYKITNNLSYMLGAAYFFTGDYYKGASDDNKVDDTFMVINKLTLTF